jgi:hypothetical protein
MEYKIGDVVRILERPGCWASEFNENCPTQLPDNLFPLEGEITQLCYNKDGRSDYSPVEIGNYGYDLHYLVTTNNIELVKREDMSYLIKIFKKLKIK